MYKLIDTHVHLDQIKDLEGALSRAKDAGIEALIAMGSSCESNKKLLEIANAAHAIKIYLALGIHPDAISETTIDETLRFIETNIKNVIAIGEIGLDYWYKEVKKDRTRREAQQNLFRTQLQLAKKYNLPVSIHSRGAWDGCLMFCLEEKIEKAVFHWYSGPVDIAQKIIANNYFISATPALAYSPQHQQAISVVPLEKLLLETDSPVFFGERETGFFSEPKDVARSLQHAAKLKNIPEAELATRAFENTVRFFAIQP